MNGVVGPRSLSACRGVVAAAARKINPLGAAAALDYLCRALPDEWAEAYRRSMHTTADLCTVTFGRQPGRAAPPLDPVTGQPAPFISVMFDHASSAGSAGKGGHEDRVVAVWGLSRPEPAGTRDKARMAGFLRGAWSEAYPGDDRGHFFAHTMGGGVDINLFPQLASVNRGGLWRRLETEAADNPGTFCFIRPIYTGRHWRPAEIEYGLIRMPPRTFGFEGYVFPN